jgi:hypothetical protein
MTAILATVNALSGFAMAQDSNRAGVIQLTVKEAENLKINNAKAIENIQGGLTHIWQVMRQKMNNGLSSREAFQTALAELTGHFTSLQAYMDSIAADINAFSTPAPVQPNTAKPDETDTRKKGGAKQKTDNLPAKQQKKINQTAFNQAAAVNQLLSGMNNPAERSQYDKPQNGKTPIETESLEKTDKKTGKEVFLIAAYQPKGVGRDDGGAKIPTALLLKNEQQAQAQSQARFGQALRLSFDRLAIDINLLNHYGEPVAYKATGAGKVGSPTPSYIYTDTDTATGLG